MCEVIMPKLGLIMETDTIEKWREKDILLRFKNITELFLR